MKKSLKGVVRLMFKSILRNRLYEKPDGSVSVGDDDCDRKLLGFLVKIGYLSYNDIGQCVRQRFPHLSVAMTDVSVRYLIVPVEEGLFVPEHREPSDCGGANRRCA
jgi:hypothetical protein